MECTSVFGSGSTSCKISICLQNMEWTSKYQKNLMYVPVNKRVTVIGTTAHSGKAKLNS